MNLAESQELQALYYNKHIKKHSYRHRKSVWLNNKQIKIQKNPKFEHRYLAFFEILEVVKMQVYKLLLSAK